ncbi:hypothetical protein ScPMuIL_015263 [Solemya velum]
MGSLICHNSLDESGVTCNICSKRRKYAYKWVVYFITDSSGFSLTEHTGILTTWWRDYNQSCLSLLWA